ncbi:hypothetical protein Tco_1110763 [Tanacetum coccineum]|uniref:Uncharacterized protein n=1 Tax=Tanacetum coccineum TaxID=301880 RepID=A0ABQ5IL83_9ASTR
MLEIRIGLVLFQGLQISMGMEMLRSLCQHCTVKPRKRDAAYLQTQLQIVQKEEAGIQLNFEEFDFMAAAGACEETEKLSYSILFSHG